MRMWVAAGFLLGVALAGALVLTHEPAALAGAVAASGWGILGVCAYRLFSLSLDTLSWRRLLLRQHRPRLPTLLRLRWIGESVNTLLPVAHVGGDLARARLLTLRGIPPSDAVASMALDLTVGVATQILFTLVGLGALALRGPIGDLGRPIQVGLGMVLAGATALAALVHTGPRRVVGLLAARPARLPGWKELAGGASALDGSLRALLARRRDLAIGAGWHLAAWLSHAGETWLCSSFLQTPVTWVDAVILESLASGVRSAAFLIPGGLGVQEGAFLLLAPRFGLTPEGGLAITLLKRVRELALGAPGLVAWSVAEHRGLGRLLSRLGRRPERPAP